MQQLIELRDEAYGHTVYDAACLHDNITLLRRLDTTLHHDFYSLTNHRNSGDTQAARPLSSAATGTRNRLLSYLVLEKGLNIAENPVGCRDKFTAIERAGHTKSAKKMVTFLTHLRKHSAELFDGVVAQIHLSQTPSLQQSLKEFQGLQELFDIHNPNLASSMKEAVAKANQSYNPSS